MATTQGSARVGQAERTEPDRPSANAASSRTEQACKYTTNRRVYAFYNTIYAVVFLRRL